MNVFSYRNTKINFMKAHGGDILSKGDFIKAVKHKLMPISSAGASVVENGMKQDLANGAKTFKQIKKMRKDLVTGRNFKFVRIRGRIVPIRIKK